MQAEVIAIGSELTSGHTINTNASYLARQLERVGILCPRLTAIRDDRALIARTLQEALRRCQLVITTGGLGPTFDDITMEAISHATARALVFVPGVARQIRAFYRVRHRRLARQALRQAYLPAGATALPNPLGTAAGLWLSLRAPFKTLRNAECGVWNAEWSAGNSLPALRGAGQAGAFRTPNSEFSGVLKPTLNSKLLIALPGVPQEMRAIMEQSVLPRLCRRIKQVIVSRTIRTVGLLELQIQRLLRGAAIPDSVGLGLYPRVGAVDVRLTLSARTQRRAVKTLDQLEGAIRQRLGLCVYGIEDQTLEGAVGEALARRHLSLAIAESCTGGLVSDRITNVPGSSRYFLLSFVAYHNDTKQKLLDVSPTILKRYGAVSAQAAKAMAQGVRKLACADLGLAITGIAGPTGGTRHKPVGLVYLALADRKQTAARRLIFQGERRMIKEQTTQAALDWLRRWVCKEGR